MEKSRLEMFSDGIFAIVITLLVLDIKISRHLSQTDAALKNGLLAILPKVIAYVLSFCIVGIFWNAHCTIFRLIKSVNKKLTWLNVCYLMVVAFIPFPTSILAEYHNTQTAIILYSFILGLAGFFHFIIIQYVYGQRHLADETFTAQVKKGANFPSLFGPLTYVTAILVSFASHMLSYFLLIVVPVYYIFFNNITRHPTLGSR